MGNKMNDYKRVKHELVYEGVMIDFYADQMLLPNGNTAIWDSIEHKGAAAIVPVTQDGRIVMVRQYRNAIERETLEIPAGCLNPGEDMKTCAERELEEETGYRCERVEHLFDMYTTAAYSNEKIGIFYATDLTASKQHLDEDEFVMVESYTLEELKQFIFEGKIMDGKTIAAIMAYGIKIQG